MTIAPQDMTATIIRVAIIGGSVTRYMTRRGITDTTTVATSSVVMTPPGMTSAAIYRHRSNVISTTTVAPNGAMTDAMTGAATSVMRAVAISAAKTTARRNSARVGTASGWISMIGNNVRRTGSSVIKARAARIGARGKVTVTS